MTTDIYAREIHEITFSARVIDGVDDDGNEYPEAVIVTGCSFLQASAIADIAQEAINSYYGSYAHGYTAKQPSDWSSLDESEKEAYRVEVES